MTRLLLLLLLTITYSSYGQNNLPKQLIRINCGFSKHSTGDMNGLIFSTEYVKYFKKKLSLTLALTGTIHDGYRPLFFTDSIGNSYDGSIRYTTAGVQIGSHFGYSLMRTNSQELQFRIGALLRYQSSSYFDYVEILFPTLTGLPIPVNYFINTSPQRTFAVGGSTQVEYNYTFRNQIILGIIGGFQMDTNADNILQLSLTIGKRF